MQRVKMGITNDILRRFFAGRYSRNDYLVVHEQFSKKQDQQHFRELLEAHWMDYEPEETSPDEVDNLLHKIQHRVFLEENRKVIRFRQVRQIQRIAAMLFLPLLLSFLIYLFLDTRNPVREGFAEIRSPRSGRTYFVLPDGSRGFLNNGSILRYPLLFADNRKVNLKGEAYFDVVPTGNDFHVLTQELDVRVMGTTFNVSAYEDDQYEAVILENGKVQVNTSGGKELAILNPNQQLIYTSGLEDIQLKDVNASLFMAWTEGKLVFRNEEMEEVVKRMSRWYNADIEISDPDLKSFTFHATFMDEPLDEILKLLSLTTPIIYEEEKRNIPYNGQTLEKRKIILKTDKKRIPMFK